MSEITIPNEIWIPSANIKALTHNDQKNGIFYTTNINSTEIKYLSEQYVNELLAEKDNEIERLKSELADVKQCLAFTISCITPADFEEMKYKAKKLLNIE